MFNTFFSPIFFRIFNLPRHDCSFISALNGVWCIFFNNNVPSESVVIKLTESLSKFAAVVYFSFHGQLKTLKYGIPSGVLLKMQQLACALDWCKRNVFLAGMIFWYTILQVLNITGNKFSSLLKEVIEIKIINIAYCFPWNDWWHMFCDLASWSDNNTLSCSHDNLAIA